MEMEIPTGTLVRLIEQDIEGQWISYATLKDNIGVVVDNKIESSWVSGHGPFKQEMSLVSWNSGLLKWVYSDNLTTYGL